MAGNKKSRSLQTRIAFSPLPSSSPAARDYPQQIQDRAAAVRYESMTPSPAKRRRIQISSPDNEATTNAYLPTPDTPLLTTTTRDPRRPQNKSRQQRLDLGSLHATARPENSSRQIATALPEENADQASSDESDVVPVRSTKKRLVGGGMFGSSASSIRTRGQTRLDLEPRDDAPTTNSPIRLDSDSAPSDDEDDMPTTLGTRKRGAQQAHVQRTSSPAFDEPSDEEVEVTQVRKRQRSEQLDDSDDEILSATPKRRKLKRNKVITQQDRSDLAEDLEFLEPDSDVDTPRRPRDSQSVRKIARMSALEALKRKRSGKPAEPESEAEETLVGDLDDQYISSHPEDNPLPASSRSIFQADEQDEDFVVDEDEDTLGVPDGLPEDLPIEFSKYASSKPRELFKYAIEWMVQRKINPAFNITDGLYKLTFGKLNDQVSGLVGSKFSSSAWTSDFVTSLKSRPAIAVQTHEGANGDFLSTHCDACNRTNHPATMAIQFQGKPYHPETLDNVELKGDLDDDDNAESSSESDDDKSTYNAQNQKVPPASRVYNVGRFCGANATIAHELSHWKINLYDMVVGWIVSNGYNTPEKLVERDGWSTKKRRKFANKIADRMAEQGFTDRVWREFQDTITRARDSKQGRY